MSVSSGPRDSEGRRGTRLGPRQVSRTGKAGSEGSRGRSEGHAPPDSRPGRGSRCSGRRARAGGLGQQSEPRGRRTRSRPPPNTPRSRRGEAAATTPSRRRRTGLSQCPGRPPHAAQPSASVLPAALRPRTASHLAPPTPLPTLKPQRRHGHPPSLPGLRREAQGTALPSAPPEVPLAWGCCYARSREEVFGTLNNPLLPLFPPPQPASVPKWRRPDPQCSGPSLARA